MGLVKAVNDVSFDLNEDETLALVGESGCGKTTTSRCVIQAIKPTSGQVLFSLDGTNPVDLVKNRGLGKPYGCYAALLSAPSS